MSLLVHGMLLPGPSGPGGMDGFGGLGRAGLPGVRLRLVPLAGFDDACDDVRLAGITKAYRPGMWRDDAGLDRRP